MFKYLVEQR